MAYRLVGFGGFLSLPQDLLPLGVDYSVDLFSNNSKIDSFSFADLTNTFHPLIEPQDILLGYSLGGRIVLHLCDINQPKAAIFISTHVGLKTVVEQEARLQTDSLWASRFMKDHWATLLKAWEAQTVFVGAKPWRRDEQTFNRKKLAFALQHASLGLQVDFRFKIRHWNFPMLWICGALDSKFVTLMKDIQSLNPQIECCIISGASHRVVQDAPDLVYTAIDKFRRRICGKQ